ncbi:MAG: cation:proton antiporter [Bacillota bacterium]
MSLEMIQKLKEFQEWHMLHQAGDKGIYVIAILLGFALISVLITKKMKTPIVVGYVFLGILLSVDVIRAIPFLSQSQKAWYEFSLESFNYVTTIALAFIAFTIGSELSIKMIKKMGKNILVIVILQSIGGFLIVSLSVYYLIGQPVYIALLLGAISSATAPAATVMVLHEYNAEGPLTSMIMAVVGIDDAIALIIFSLIRPLAMTQYKGTGGFSFSEALLHPSIEVLGSILLGILIGYFSQKGILSFEDKTKKIMTIVVTILSSSAISIYFNLSPLITNMSVGFAYRNFAHRNPGIDKYLDTMTTPLYALFFILAGTEIRLSGIFTGGFLLIALVYFVARITGKIGGAYLAGVITNAPEVIKKYVGLGLLPQSGVAIAMAYTVQKQFASAPEVGLLIFNTLLFTAAITEVVGPFATKYAITKAGEIHEY